MRRRNNESHKIFYRCEKTLRLFLSFSLSLSLSLSVCLSLSLDVVTYFLRLIDKGSYSEGNAVMKVYKVGGTKRD